MTGVLVVRQGGLRTRRPVLSAERRPEWWLYVVAAAGWAVFVLAEAGRALGRGHHPVAVPVEQRPGSLFMAPGNDRGHLPTPGPAAASDPSWWSSATEAAWLHHGLLTLAMVAVMVPLIAPNVRYAALRSPRASRGGVTVAVVTGWASVWVLAGAGVAVVGGLLTSGGVPAAMAAATAFAAGWQWTTTKRRSVARCHRVVAPPLPPAAARVAGRSYGRGLGRDCAAACAPMMLLMAVSSHALLVTVAVAGVAWYERRRRPHHDPAPGRTAAVLASAGALGMAMAAVGLV